MKELDSGIGVELFEHEFQRAGHETVIIPESPYPFRACGSHHAFESYGVVNIVLKANCVDASEFRFQTFYGKAGFRLAAIVDDEDSCVICYLLGNRHDTDSEFLGTVIGGDDEGQHSVWWMSSSDLRNDRVCTQPRRFASVRSGR